MADAAEPTRVKNEGNEEESTTNDGALRNPNANARTRKRLVRRFAAVREELADLDLELQAVGERDLADTVKRARREFELTERQGIPQARGV